MADGGDEIRSSATEEMMSSLPASSSSSSIRSSPSSSPSSVPSLQPQLINDEEEEEVDTLDSKDEVKEEEEEVVMEEEEEEEEERISKPEDPMLIAEQREKHAKSVRGRYSMASQLLALTVKQVNLQKRSYGTNICQLLTPVLLMLVIVAFQLYIDYFILTSSSPEILHPISLPPKTRLYPTDEVATLLSVPYARSAVVNASALGSFGNGTGLLGEILSPPIFYVDYNDGEDSTLFSAASDFVRLFPVPYSLAESPNEAAINAKLFAAYGDIPALYPYAWMVNQLDLAAQVYDFSVWYNETLAKGVDIPAGIVPLTSALMSSLTNGSMRSLLSSVRNVPTVSKRLTFDLASAAGPFFFNLILHQLLPVLMYTIVLEKELRLREFMKMMGLRMHNYWIVNWAWDALLYFFVMNFMVIIGVILQFRFFTVNAFIPYYLLFLIWGYALVALAFFMSVFINKGRTALVLGYLYVLMLIPVTIWLVGDIVSNPDTNPAVLAVLSLEPSFALYRGLTYLALQVQFDGPGYQLSDMAWDSPVSLGQVYVYLFCIGTLLYVLTWYLEQVLPSGFGVKRSPFFLVQPSYWRRTIFFKWTSLLRRRRGTTFHPAVIRTDDPPDVRAEEELTYGLDSSTALRVVNMLKEYGSSFSERFRAVDHVSFHAEHGECVGMLGPNGAGKTTLLSILSGLFEATSGTAEFYGYDLHGDIEAIHSFMGVCPQFDIVWPDMTGSEHMYFYARLKNVPMRRATAEIDELLRAVNLYDTRTRQAQRYSGGMRRRLSVAISLVGSPKIVFLDEPSTGLDPRARQALWQLINSRKPTCAMILTTHSMEEAEALSDRIVVMSRGRVRAVGTSTALKSRFAEGYLLSINYRHGQVLQGEAALAGLLPGLHMERSISSTRDYRVQDVKMSQLFSLLEEHRDACCILDWGVRNSTLEEAFEKITADDFRAADEEFLHDYSDSEYETDVSSDDDRAPDAVDASASREELFSAAAARLAFQEEH